MTLWLLIHGGYDFEPTTLAVCSTKKRAEKMMVQHYAVPEHADHPWNKCWIEKATLDGWVPYEKESVRSLGARKETGQAIGRGDLVGLAVEAMGQDVVRSRSTKNTPASR